MQIFFPGPLGCRNKKTWRRQRSSVDHSAQEKSRYRASRNEYCKKNLGEISKLLITHPLKTQTIGTGIVINEIPFLTSFVMKLMMDLRSAVAIWPVTGQGFQNTKWPAVLYYQ